MFLKTIKEDRKGEVLTSSKYNHLYHLTDNHGFSFTVNNNALKTLRHSYISTTHNPEKNFVLGYNHYDFKFILNGKALAETYGIFTYDAYAWEVDGHRQKRVSLNEDEIGINTDTIRPFSNYCEGLRLLFDIFSEKGIQWLMYNNNNTKSFLDVAKSAAPRAIESLNVFMYDWNLPVYNKNNQPLSKKELEFLSRVTEINKSPHSTFRKAMRRLVMDYPLVDHDGDPLDRATVLRMQMGDSITEIFNKYFQNRRIADTKPEEVKELVIRCLKMMRFNNNIVNTILSYAEEQGLFHPTTPVVEWSIVFGDLMTGDVDQALSSIKYVSNRNKHIRDRFDQNDQDDYLNISMRKYNTHAGTSFTSMGNR